MKIFDYRKNIMWVKEKRDYQVDTGFREPPILFSCGADYSVPSYWYSKIFNLQSWRWHFISPDGDWSCKLRKPWSRV